MPSLIQQRLALNRERAVARWLTGSGAALLMLGVVSMFVGQSERWWFNLIVPAGLLAYGAFRLWANRLSRSSFEAEHGVDAGKQPVVGRPASRRRSADR